MIFPFSPISSLDGMDGIGSDMYPSMCTCYVRTQTIYSFFFRDQAHEASVNETRCGADDARTAHPTLSSAMLMMISLGAKVEAVINDVNFFCAKMRGKLFLRKIRATTTEWLFHRRPWIVSF